MVCLCMIAGNVCMAEDVVRSPREAIEGACEVCDVPVNVIPVPCQVSQLEQQVESQLQALMACCINTNQFVKYQGGEEKKMLKKLHHEIDEVEDFLESHIGKLSESTAFDVPNTTDIIGFVNSMDVDVVTWLKSLYVLAYRIWQCTCNT